jgi:hypothetical protein
MTPEEVLRDEVAEAEGIDMHHPCRFIAIARLFYLMSQTICQTALKRLFVDLLRKQLPIADSY